MVSPGERIDGTVVALAVQGKVVGPLARRIRLQRRGLSSTLRPWAWCRRPASWTSKAVRFSCCARRTSARRKTWSRLWIRFLACTRMNCRRANSRRSAWAKMAWAIAFDAETAATPIEYDPDVILRPITSPSLLAMRRTGPGKRGTRARNPTRQDGA